MPPSTSSPSRRVLRRVLVLCLGAAATLILIAVLLWLGINLALASDAVQARINRRPEKMLVEWTSARMLRPGEFELEGLELRGQSRRVQWWAELERVRLHVDLWALKSREFRASGVRGDGLRFRLRDLKAAANETRTPYLPDIPGLALPEPSPRRSLPRRPPGARIELEGLDLRGFDEIWINEYRLQGDGRISGDLQIQVRGPLAARGLDIAYSEARLLIGRDAAAESLELDVNVDLAPVETRGLGLDEILSALDSRSHIDAEVNSLTFLRYYLRHANFGLTGQGHLQANIGLVDRRFTADSSITVEADELVASLPRFSVRGSGLVSGDIDTVQGEPPATSLRVAFHDIGLVARGQDSPAIVGPRVDLLVRSATVDPTTGFPDPSVLLELPGLEIPDLTVANHFIPAGLGLRLASGSASLDARIDVSRAEGDGELAVHGEDVGFELHGRPLDTDLDVLVRYAGSLDRQRTSVAGTRIRLRGSNASDARNWSAELTIDKASFGLTKPVDDTNEPGWQALRPADGHVAIGGHVSDLSFLNDFLSYGRWLRLYGPVDLGTRLVLRSTTLAPGSSIQLTSQRLRADFLNWQVEGRATIEGRLLGRGAETVSDLQLQFDEVAIVRDGMGHFRGPDLSLHVTGPDLSGGRNLEDLQVRAAIRGAELFDMRTLNRFLPESGILALISGTSSLDGIAELSQSHGLARLTLQSDEVEARIRGERVAMALGLDIDMTADDPLSREFVLRRGTLVINQARALGDGENVSDPWSARVNLTAGTVALEEPLSVDTRVAFELEDTRPILFLLAERSPHAAWFERWLLAKQVAGSARLHVGADSLRIEDLSLRGGPVRLEADLTLPASNSDLDPIERVQDLNVRAELLEPFVVEASTLNQFLGPQSPVVLTDGEGALRGVVRMTDADADADLELDGSSLQVRIRDDPIATDLSLRVAMTSEIAARRLDLGGTTLRLSNTRWLGDAKAQQRPPWYGELTVVDGEVELDHPLTVDADVRFRLLDTRPLVYMLAQESKVVRWFQSVLEIEKVDGTASLYLGDEGMRLDDVAIEGQGLSIKAQMDFAEGSEHVLVHVRFHGLAAAVELRDGERELKILKPREWYLERLEAWNQAASAAAP